MGVPGVAAEGQWLDSGAWVQEAPPLALRPVRWCLLVSGYEAFPCSTEEAAEWQKRQDATPEEGQKVLASRHTEQKDPMSPTQEEEETEWRSGVY